MACYNLMKPQDRARRRSRRVAELRAIENGEWPRDIEDTMRWTCPQGILPAEWAKQMCEAEIEYLDDVDVRIRAGDPGLAGWQAAWGAPQHA